MITLSYGTLSAELRSVLPQEDERQFDSSMIIRRTHAGNPIIHREDSWEDFDTIVIKSKSNTESDIVDFKSVLDASIGKTITVDVAYAVEYANIDDSVNTRFTGVIISPLREIITVRDCDMVDVEFELLIETEGAIPA